MSKINDIKDTIKERLEIYEPNKLLDRKGNWMETFSGVKFYPLDAQVDEIKIEDIAHALSNICRWGGHSKSFYSVAQHCVLVSQLVTKDCALEGLMHDASEAYLIDLPTPIKRMIPQYREIEAKLSVTLSQKYGYKYPYPDEVTRQDFHSKVIEYNALLSTKEIRMFEGKVPTISIKPWLPEQAEDRFLVVFNKLYKERHGN
jgi:uncharacterized protein